MESELLDGNVLNQLIGWRARVTLSKVTIAMPTTLSLSARVERLIGKFRDHQRASPQHLSRFLTEHTYLSRTRADGPILLWSR